MNALLLLASSFWLVWFPLDVSTAPVVLSFPTYELCRQTAYAYEPKNPRWWTPEQLEINEIHDKREKRIADEKERVQWMHDVQTQGVKFLDNVDVMTQIDDTNVYGLGGKHPSISSVGFSFRVDYQHRFVGDCQEIKTDNIDYKNIEGSLHAIP